MFKKALSHQSNATPIRTSARRHLLSEVLDQYRLFLGLERSEASPSGAVDDDDGSTPPMTEKELGKLIMPDGLRSSTFTTSGGIDGTLYSSAEGDPLWMSFGRNSKDLIPTCESLSGLYVLNKDTPYPPLPLIQVHYPVPPPLFTGAPLFLPAVKHITRPWMLPNLPEGSIVAFVTSPDDNSDLVEYLGVGRIAAKGGTKAALERFMRHRREGVDVDEGKFADILCIHGDHLWDSGSKPKLGRFAHPLPVIPIAPPPTASSNAGSVPSSSALVSGAAERIATLSVDDSASSDTDQRAAADTALEPLSANEVSTLLSISLLQALSTLSNAEFPMPASTLYSAHVLPSRPAYIPKDRRETVVVARSEWKKLAKWMKEASKEKLVSIKESKGEATVTGFDPDHPSLQSHKPFLTIAQEEIRQAKRAAREAAEAGDSETGGKAAAGGSAAKGAVKQVVVEDLWKPAGSAVEFWESLGVDKASWHPPNIVRPKLDEFVDTWNLADPTDRRKVRVGSESLFATALGKGRKGNVMLRDDIARILRADGQVAHSVNGVVKKGNIQPISISIKTRAGRKTVTLISGFETFGVNPDDLADELRRVCTASATVGPLTGASPKLNLQEIMVQGTQTKLVTEALISRGVPKRYIK